MKKLFFLAVFCLLAGTSQMSAQLIIRNSGHAEVGVNPFTNDVDTASMLKIFGPEVDHGAKGRIAFGDSAYVTIGEFGTTNTNQMWLHGKNGIYMTVSPNSTPDSIFFYDPERSDYVNFSKNVRAAGVFLNSDERYKENIEPVENVLTSLLNLEPVSYQLKSLRPAGRMKKINQYSENDNERYGFLAQNVKEVFPRLVHTDNNGYMSVDYIGLIPILVQSINELQARISELEGETESAGQNELEASLTDAKLYQNAPNPWSSETIIRYRLPMSVANACIYIYDMQGTQLKSVPATGRGESQVTLTARDLKAGMYIYALVADGKLIESKQMILTK